MPLTDELGNLCLERSVELAQRAPARGFDGGRFEVWLSELAIDQPYLTVSENYANRALFHRFGEAIAAVLGERVLAALADGWPRWLPTFVKLAHVTRATIITFNYDTLVECAVATRELIQDPRNRESIRWEDVIGKVPTTVAGAETWPADETLQLLKLHG